MTAEKHTPGPWKLNEVIGGSFVYAGSRQLIAMPSPDLENKANARLIAAAPRMAAALQRADHFLAELPEQTHYLLALRREIVDTIMEATPEYYGGGAS